MMTMSKNASIAISAVAVIAACAFIFLMSSRAGGESGALSRAIVDFFVQFLVPGYSQMLPMEQTAWYDAIHLVVRKLAHFSEFAILGALSANLLVRLEHTRMTTRASSAEGDLKPPSDARSESRPRLAYVHQTSLKDTSASGLRNLKSYAIAWAFSVAYAASDEIHQLFVPGRACMPLDVLIDSSGALAGVAIFALVVKLLIRHRNVA